MSNLRTNYQNTIDSIKNECKSLGIPEDSITLVAVSKTREIEDIRTVFEEGQVVFGENRAREVQDKNELLPEVQWHMIGRLQKNKVKYIAPFITMIHSVDSEELLMEIDRQALKNERIIDVLIQVNISNEKQKGGALIDDLPDLVELCNELSNIRLRGLMGMAEHTKSEEKIFSQFQTLKKIHDQLLHFEDDNTVFNVLSMGMTHDFKIALKAGANMLRIGSAIFS